MLFNALLAATSASLAAAAALPVSPRASITDFTTSPVSFAFPPGRGFSASTATEAPCGGFAATTPTTYPLTGGQIALTQSTAVDELNFLWYKGSNPTKFHEFTTYTNTIDQLGAGHYCGSAPDFASLGFADGDTATLLLAYYLDGEKTWYYQCSDVKLVGAAAYVKTDSYVCGNYTSQLEVASSDDSLKLTGGSYGASAGVMGDDEAHPTTGAAAAASTVTGASTKATAAASVSENDGGLSATEGGGIGAGVTLAVVALALGALWAMGRVHFGRRQVLSLDSHSSSSSLPIKQNAH